MRCRVVLLLVVERAIVVRCRLRVVEVDVELFRLRVEVEERREVGSEEFERVEVSDGRDEVVVLREKVEAEVMVVD